MTKRECLLVLIFAVTFFLFTGNDGAVVAQDTEQLVDVCDVGTAVRLKSVTAKFNDFKQEIGAITTTIIADMNRALCNNEIVPDANRAMCTNEIMGIGTKMSSDITRLSIVIEGSSTMKLCK